MTALLVVGSRIHLSFFMILFQIQASEKKLKKTPSYLLRIKYWIFIVLVCAVIQKMKVCYKKHTFFSCLINSMLHIVVTSQRFHSFSA